jgi:hypothetical protein
MLRRLRGCQCHMLVLAFEDFRLRCQLLAKFVRFLFFISLFDVCLS